MSGIYLAKSLLIPGYREILRANAESEPSPSSAHMRNVLLGFPQLMRFAADWLFRIRLARRKLSYTLLANADGSYPLEFNSEQTPLPSSRVTLTEERDRHGLSRMRIEWQVSEQDVVAAYRGLLLLRETLARSGTCRLELAEERIRRSPPLGGHHIGAPAAIDLDRRIWQTGVVETL
jgi:hypothetical protein